MNNNVIEKQIVLYYSIFIIIKLSFTVYNSVSGI